MPEPEFIPTPSTETSAESPAAPSPEEPILMLDVHPAHHAATGWKEFFVHIATIVLGLLIAVSLEQAVEHVHHLREVTEAREALRREREANLAYFKANTASVQWEAAQLKNNLRVLTFLQQRPGTSEERLPGVLLWGFTHEEIVDSSWKNTQQTQVLTFMPWDETENIAMLYNLLEVTNKDALTALDAVNRAGSYTIVDPNPSHLTPAQVAAEIELVKDAMQANIRWAVHLKNLHQQFADFSPGPDDRELSRMAGWVRDAEDVKKLAAASAITNASLAPLDAAMMDAIKKADDRH